ncbi:MAG TPA: RES family NAD+ phosphorylase [Flavisolibacter sp.]|nr:RES family NAD+ phosphorylase [Flavisolibacter sp.]
MLVYRITHKIYSKQLFASGLEGRWNGDGKKVIYTAGSVALAFLENMIRRQGVGFNSDFKTMIIEIPDDLKIQVIKNENLAAGWREFTDYSKCQPLGNAWFDKGEKPVLKVPSAVLPEEFNYVINAAHPDFKKIKLVETTELIPDERIEDILKNYSKK